FRWRRLRRRTSDATQPTSSSCTTACLRYHGRSIPPAGQELWCVRTSFLPSSTMPWPCRSPFWARSRLSSLPSPCRFRRSPWSAMPCVSVQGKAAKPWVRKMICWPRCGQPRGRRDDGLFLPHTGCAPPGRGRPGGLSLVAAQRAIRRSRRRGRAHPVRRRQAAERRSTEARPMKLKTRLGADTPLAAVAIVALSIVGVLALTLWYLVKPQPLLVQGEADATRVDIAARVDGRVATRAAHRGENVQAGQVLVTIDNPELLTRLKEAEAARTVAAADFKRIEVGTRFEVVDARRPALEAAQAKAKLAEQAWDRTRQLTARDFASVQKLDEATASLDVARRSQQQAKLALEEAVNGYTAEERGVAQAAVVKADAAIATLRAQVAELTVKSPAAAQVYHTGADPGEYVSPGVPLLTLVDLSDIWLRFDLREDLVK